MTIKNVTLLLPIYNEESAILPFMKAFDEFYIELTKNQKHLNFELLFINDGSSDHSAKILTDIISLSTKKYTIKLINLSRNFGKEHAMKAGFDHAIGDALIPYDIDMQDPLPVINDMLVHWQKGYDVVNAKRIDRSQENFIKRHSASLYYSILNTLSEGFIADQVGDFRLLDRKVYKTVSLLNEKNRFTKGLMSWVGFRTTEVTYSRQQREHGHTKFNVRKLIKLGLDGIFAFSDKPIRLSAYIGLFFMLVAFGLGLDILIKTLMFGNPVAGYPSIMTVILFSFGLLFLMQGLQGEYIARIYNEVKNRPVYIIDSIVEQSQ